MKKLVIVVLIGIMAVSGAFARGGSQSGKTPLTLYTWAGGAEAAMIEAVVSDFEASHPNIRVEQNHGELSISVKSIP